VQKSVGPKRYRFIHTTMPDLSTSYLASLQQLFRPPGRDQMGDRRAAGTAPPVANANSTPDCQKFAMIRLILKLA
jgi:hypothetical protein